MFNGNLLNVCCQSPLPHRFRVVIDSVAADAASTKKALKNLKRDVVLGPENQLRSF